MLAPGPSQIYPQKKKMNRCVCVFCVWCLSCSSWMRERKVENFLERESKRWFLSGFGLFSFLILATFSERRFFCTNYWIGGFAISLSLSLSLLPTRNEWCCWSWFRWFWVCWSWSNWKIWKGMPFHFLLWLIINLFLKKKEEVQIHGFDFYFLLT